MIISLMLVASVFLSKSSTLDLPPGLTAQESIQRIIKCMENIQWQSVHLAAAAACRGSRGGQQPTGNYVYPHSYPYTCNAVCKSVHMVCDASISIQGAWGRVERANQAVGQYYNNGCGNRGLNLGELNPLENNSFFGYCCCRFRGKK